jgi:hypothetical protein
MKYPAKVVVLGVALGGLSGCTAPNPLYHVEGDPEADPEADERRRDASAEPPAVMDAATVDPPEANGTAADAGDDGSLAEAGGGEELNGLRAEVYDNPDLRGDPLIRLDREINFHWDDGLVDPAVEGDEFSVRWTALVEPRFSEDYVFSAYTNDGVRLWVNGMRLIDNWHDQYATRVEGKIRLKAGQRVALTMEFFHYSGPAIATLSWSSASEPRAIIPAERLFPPPLQPESP